MPRRPALALGLLLAATLGGAAARADADQELRAQAGVKLFRALLAADENIARKADGNGHLLLVFLYTSDRDGASELAAAAREAQGAEGGATIKDLPVDTEVTDDATLSKLGRVPAGVFLAQPPRANELAAIVRYGIDHGIIVYSPFEGHVEAGVLGGLSVGARVQPYINARTMQASHLSIKAFFLKVAKVYE